MSEKSRVHEIIIMQGCGQLWIEALMSSSVIGVGKSMGLLVQHVSARWNKTAHALTPEYPKHPHYFCPTSDEPTIPLGDESTRPVVLRDA
jgi:hypothetical protein